MESFETKYKEEDNLDNMFVIEVPIYMLMNTVDNLNIRQKTRHGGDVSISDLDPESKPLVNTTDQTLGDFQPQ